MRGEPVRVEDTLSSVFLPGFPGPGAGLIPTRRAADPIRATSRPRTEPDAPVTPLFSADDYASMRGFFRDRPELTPTPLTPLPALAARLGVAALLVKDESARFGLNAFKLLGTRFAVERLLADGLIRRGDTLVCASEGNHGRAVAHTARAMGYAARIYLAAGVAGARAEAISAEGAAVVRVPGTYDDAVRQAAADAAREGWVVVSDTSWDGYERVPHLIMLGYTRMMDEMVGQMGAKWRPDALFVQAGVGGLLAAVAAWSAAHWTPRPVIAAVEPASAACLQASARAGAPTPLAGPFPTTMGGLRCGEVSPLAFNGARAHVDAYLAIEDAAAYDAMRLLARPSGGDPAIHAGPSGAAALAGLAALLRAPDAASAREWLGLGPASTVVAIVTEGITDSALWSDVMAPA